MQTGCTKYLTSGFVNLEVKFKLGRFNTALSNRPYRPTLPTQLHIYIFVYRAPPPIPPAADYADPVDENDEIYDIAEQIQQQEKQKVKINRHYFSHN